MYVLMAVVFLVIAGLEALVMRWQLIRPGNTFLAPDPFNQLFTMHGTTMVFFMGMPILIGIGNYLVPLHDRRPRHGLSAAQRVGVLGDAVRRPAGLFQFLYSGGPPAIGWFAYAPLTERTFARGAGADFWALGLMVSGIGTIAAGVNFIATILGMRCPGMTLRKGAVLRLDDALDQRADPACHSAADRGAGRWCCSTGSWGPISSIRRTAARPICGSTCSGSSATPRFTS